MEVKFENANFGIYFDQLKELMNKTIAPIYGEQSLALKKN